MALKGCDPVPTENPRITFAVDKYTLDKITEYRFEHRLKNQTQAVLTLIEKGLNSLNSTENKSILEETILTDDELSLLENYRKLSREGKQYILQTMSMAVQSYGGKSNAASDMETAL